ncbi:MAG: anti-sigma factor family protein [Gemmatimonadaceae bacterium]
MTHEVIRHLLDDYVTGELNEDARAPVAEHVAACEICSAEVESLKQVLARAAQLPKSIDPPAEAWSNIRSVILRDEQVGKRRDMRRRPIWRHPFMSAIAAAVVVAVLSSAATALYLGARAPSARDVRNAAAAAADASDTATPATLAAFTIEENNYLRNASILQDLLDQREAALAPETVAQIKASLRTIDEAILEARNALARDPANKMLVEMLSASYKQKVDLLRRSTEMTRGS